MRSKILAAFAFTGLLMTAIPLTASARDTANCWTKPAWGYQHPNLYKSWRRLHCGAGYGNQGNYFGNGGGNYFGNGGGWWPTAPAYTQYQGAPYYDRDERYEDEGWGDRGHGWNGWRGEHRDWDRGHDGDRWRGRQSHEGHHEDHHEGHHEHH
jgi:hypothetical protein